MRRYLLTYVAMFLGSTLAKIKIRGRRNLPQKGPYVVASNHFSDYDPLFFSYAIRRPINFIAASDQELKLALVWAPLAYGWIPVNRKKISPSTIKMSLNVLKNSEILGIFPDGGVSYNLLSEPKNGAVYLSTIGRAPIVPMSIYGAERALEGLFKGIRSKVCVNIGKPFGPYNFEGSKSEKNARVVKAGKDMMYRIASLLPSNRRGKYNDRKLLDKYQIQNNIIPDYQSYFKPQKE